MSSWCSVMYQQVLIDFRSIGALLTLAKRPLIWKNRRDTSSGPKNPSLWVQYNLGRQVRDAPARIISIWVGIVYRI